MNRRIIIVTLLSLVLISLVFFLTNPTLDSHKTTIKAGILNILAIRTPQEITADSLMPESPIEADLLLDKVAYNNYYLFSISEVSLDEYNGRLGLGIFSKVYLTSDFKNLVKIGLSAMRLRVGDFYAGGIIFSISQNGQHGLVAAPADVADKASWGCSDSFVQGTSAAIGAGDANTKLIIKACDKEGIAARVCADINLYGHDDWYLPSKDELNLLYEKLHKRSLGGFKNEIYWSSTTFNGFSIWAIDFETGTSFGNENGIEFIRPVRAF